MQSRIRPRNPALLTHTVYVSSLQHAYSYIPQIGRSANSMNVKNTNQSPIHENADANITCDFVVRSIIFRWYVFHVSRTLLSSMCGLPWFLFREPFPASSFGIPLLIAVCSKCIEIVLANYTYRSFLCIHSNEYPIICIPLHVDRRGIILTITTPFTCIVYSEGYISRFFEHLKTIYVPCKYLANHCIYNKIINLFLLIRRP